MDNEDPKIQVLSVMAKSKATPSRMPSEGQTSRAVANLKESATIPAKEGFHGLWLGSEAEPLANDPDDRGWV